MIITRSPLRITLGGGGTDLPSYYREHGGFLIAAAIDKYVYVTVMRPFTPGIYLEVLQAGARRRDRRSAAPDHPRGDPDAGVQNAAGRDHDARRHSGRYRSRLVGKLHHGATEGALRHRTPASASRGTGRAGLRHRDRPARASRSASRINTSPRTAASHASPSARTKVSKPSRSRSPMNTHLQPRGQPVAVLHRLLAQRRQHPEGSERRARSE